MRGVFVAVLAAIAVVSSGPLAFAECMGGYEPTCSLMRLAPIIFLGTIESNIDGTLHFHVEEGFAGVKGSTIDILPVPFIEGSTGYADNVKRYLVFAQTVRFDGSDHAYVGGCGRQMIPYQSAGPDLEQLRREKRGQRVASAYGTLFRTGYEGSFFLEPQDKGVLPNVVLTFQSARSTVTTKTRPDGTFVVERLPKGRYRIAADLPNGLKLGQTILDEPIDPIDVASDTCHSLVITAVPTATISGHVIGPDGKPRDGLSVNLFRADNTSLHMDSWQGDGKPFKFSMLPPGDYVLAFGTGIPHPLDPNHPFPDTFYPNAPDFASATVIHLAPGQQIENADIHLPEGRPTRTLTIGLNWNGVRVADTYGVSVTATTGDGPGRYARKIPNDTYAVSLLSDAVYQIRATAYCKQPRGTAATTDTIVVDGSDESMARITLTFAPGGCTPK